MREKLLIIPILLLALFLRLIDIDRNPPALYGDELTLIYDAYSILKTGHDQTGAFLPLTFAMSEGRPPVYVYLSIPLVAVLGPNVLSARLLSVFSGVGIVLLIYLLLYALLSRRIALIGALFVAVSPWDLSLSRGGFETHLALFLSLLGITAFIKARSKPGLLIISALSFGLAIHTYHSYKVVLPLFLPILVWFPSLKVITDEKFRKPLVLFMVILVFSVGVFLYQVALGSEVRFKNTNIFNQADLAAGITQKINKERSLDKIPFSSLIHNKPIEYLTLIGENYFSHFSFDFLFLHGDKNPRHNQGLMGGMYVADSILVLLGMIWLFQRYRKIFILLGAWILISPLATIMVSPAHALRSTFMLPPLIAFSAAGFNYLLELSKKEFLARGLIMVVVLGLVIQFIFLVDRIYFLYPKQFGNFWSLQAKIVTEEALLDSKRYDYVVLSDQIDSINLAFPVYAKVDPTGVIAQYNQSVKQFGNIYIGDISNLPGQVIYYNNIYDSDGLSVIQKVTK